MPFIVEKATKEDIPCVVAIAKATRLNQGAPQPGGFLVFGADCEKYKQFERDSRKQRGVCFLVARKKQGDKCVGFLIGYNEKYVKSESRKPPGWPQGGSEQSIIELLAPSHFFLIGRTTFFIIKQIAVDPQYFGQGVARELYNNLFSNIRSDSIFAAIVADPVNQRSEKFHRLQGFSPIMQCWSFGGTEDNKSGPPRYINRVWFKPRYPAVLDYRLEGLAASIEGGAESQVTTSFAGEITEVLRTNYEQARHLYVHEDSLSWSKISALITTSGALVTGVYYLTKFSNPRNVVFNAAFAISGALVLAFLLLTLQSGLYFMHSYKQSARILESRIRLSFPDLVPLICRVPSRSITVRVLGYGIYAVLPAWLSLCLWLMLF